MRGSNNLFKLESGSVLWQCLQPINKKGKDLDILSLAKKLITVFAVVPWRGDVNEVYVCFGKHSSRVTRVKHVLDCGSNTIIFKLCLPGDTSIGFVTVFRLSPKLSNTSYFGLEFDTPQIWKVTKTIWTEIKLML